MSAQVGILTNEDPLGMFHVDPQSDTYIDTGTTPPDTLGLADDLIVTRAGNLGIGNLPQPEVDTLALRLTDGGTPSIPRSSLRIEDGNQQEGRALTGDAGGNASWQDLPATFTFGRVYGLQVLPELHLSRNNNTTSFTFTADVAGNYLFEIRFWGLFGTGRGSMGCQLLRGSTLVDSFEYYSGLNPSDNDNALTVCFTLYGEADNAGNIFTVTLSTNRNVYTQTSPAWTQSKVNVLRVN
jgi:hypothetical protein